MSGRKMAGCCVHVACLIYYLSNAKYNTIKPPAEHLNSIFVDMSTSKAPNDPQYVRNHRKSKNIVEEQSILISSDARIFLMVSLPKSLPINSLIL